MSGNRKDIVQEYLNLLAVVCHHLSRYELPAVSIPALANNNDTRQDLLFKLRKLRRACDDTSLISELRKTLTIILHKGLETSEELYFNLRVMCIWMDQSISYDADPGVDRFSILDAVGDYGTKPVTLFSLNTNCAETGIQLGPKFPVLGCCSNTINPSLSDNRDNPVANRDAFSLLNGVLHNVTVINVNPSVKFMHVIVPPSWYKRCISLKRLHVAFAPLSDNPDVLTINHGTTTRGGLDYHSIEVEGIGQANQLHDRMVRDWCAASISAEADIMVYPEVLGSNSSEDVVIMPNGEKYNKFIKRHHESLSLRKVSPPSITVMPSISNDGINEASIVGLGGLVLAHQKKYEPFISRSVNAIEHLREFEQHEYTIIHIPDVHRIAVLICSDFLNICQKGPMSLFEEACVTLALVPSFSRGESDFMKLMMHLLLYGTSVVWGNCCGASTKPLKRIGAYCSIESLSAHDFKTVCKCDGTCNGIDSCVFVTSLPLRTVFEDDIQYSSVCHFVEKSNPSVV